MAGSAGSGGRRRRRSPGGGGGGAALACVLLCASVCVVRSVSLQFSREPVSQDALHGRAALLRCEASDAAGVSFSWTQDGRPVTDSQRRYQDASNLRFTAVDRSADAGRFQCVLTRGGESLVSANASFNIKWLERGRVSMNDPASEAELEQAERIVLQCHIDGHPRPSSKWFKDGVQLSGKERILTLTELSPGHSGSYSCCARNAAGHVCSQNNLSLSIIDKSLPRVLVSPEDQVVLRGEEAVFHCQFRAKPPPLVLWFHDTEPVLNSSQVVVYANGTLHISQVKQRSTGVYKCVAQYGENKHVHVEATLRIAELADMGEGVSRVFSAGRREVVRCEAPRAVPEPQLWWERSGARVPLEGRIHQRDGELIFSPTHTSDAGVYTCVARNRAGQKQRQLHVTVATSPEWITKPQDTHVEEGEPGYLHCLTQATPEPQVTWSRRGVPITEGSRYTLFSNGTLRINRAEVTDAQTYSCTSETQAGAVSAHARVLILEKLKFAPVPQPSQCLQLGRESSVSCVATGRETPRILWSRADGADLPSRVTQLNGVLRFTAVTRADAGNYTCVAWSDAQGEIRAHVQLTVGVHVQFKQEPEPTTVYQGHTAVLHCSATGDPTPHTHWMSRDTALSGGRFQKMPNGSLVISDVSTDDTGVYTCVAGNTCSIRDAAAQLYVVEKPTHLRDGDEERGQFKMFQTVALSVAVAVAYIIGVLGLMFYCKQRRRNQRLQKSLAAHEPEMECLNGGAVHRPELQEEVCLTDLSPSADAEKQQSAAEQMHFPRADLQRITSLGRGVFGEVFLARARALREGECETLVLVKSLQSREEPLRVQFSRELQMFARLHHAHVVRLLGLCADTHPHYMILEYVDLGDLKQFLQISKRSSDKLKPHPISTKTKISICAQVARGMQHLSEQGFVHRDLAARNCLISAQRHVKISALGLSQDVYSSEYCELNDLTVPLRWLSPECVCEGRFSSASDVWAFAVLVWEVFSLAELPFSTLPDRQVLQGLRADSLRLSRPVGCPAELFSLMSRCWASRPEDRPSFAQTLEDLPTDSKV